jgi:hypothetical protein
MLILTAHVHMLRALAGEQMRHAVYDHDDYVVYVAGQFDLHHRLLVRTSEQLNGRLTLCDVVGEGRPLAQARQRSSYADRES